MAQRHDLCADHVAPGEHGCIGAGRGNVCAEGLLEERRLLGKAVDVRRRQALVAVATHVVSSQRVDAHQDDIWLSSSASFRHCLYSSSTGHLSFVVHSFAFSRTGT